jgi:hypothetical protein
MNIFLAHKICKLTCSRNFSHVIKTQLKQFSSNQNSFVQKVFKNKPFIKKSFLLSGIFTTSCYIGVKSYEKYQNEFQNILKSFFSFFIANCQDDSNRNNRTKHYEKSVGIAEDKKDSDSNDEFDWGQFFKLVWKEKSYFILAVFVSIKIYFINFRFLMN